MGRRMTPSQHEMTADARHWKRRKAQQEEREMRGDHESASRTGGQPLTFHSRDCQERPVSDNPETAEQRDEGR